MTNQKRVFTAHAVGYMPLRGWCGFRPTPLRHGRISELASYSQPLPGNAGPL